MHFTVTFQYTCSHISSIVYREPEKKPESWVQVSVYILVKLITYACLRSCACAAWFCVPLRLILIKRRSLMDQFPASGIKAYPALGSHSVALQPSSCLLESFRVSSPRVLLLSSVLAC